MLPALVAKFLWAPDGTSGTALTVLVIVAALALPVVVGLLWRWRDRRRDGG